MALCNDCTKCGLSPDESQGMRAFEPSVEKFARAEQLSSFVKAPPSTLVTLQQ